MRKTVLTNSSDPKAYIITGPTSGIGRVTALELAKHGMVVLVGRNRGKLDELQKVIEQCGLQAVSVVCDLSNPASVRRAAAEIVALNLPIAGLLNNAGIMQLRATKNALGWDMTFATNHLGPFALTEALVPHLPDGANVVFVASAVENPERNARQGGRLPRRSLYLRGGERAWRVETRRFQASGLRRLRDVEAMPSSLPRWRSPVRLRGYASARSSRASIRPPALGAMWGPSCAFCRPTSFRCSCRCSCRS